MVGLQLARRWAELAGGSARLLVAGAGSQPPAAGAEYRQLPRPGPDPQLVRYSELEYARFCGDFGAAGTRLLLADGEFEPRRTAVVVNDISESPDLDALAERGYPIVSIWHVDVVDFFNRLYLGERLRPERWTAAFARLEDLGLARLLPRVLRLVFQKQRSAVRRARLIVLPSRPMADTVRRCFPELAGRREDPLLVCPWGVWPHEQPDAEIAREVSRLRAHYRLADGSRALMTLSRISPEKGIELLLEALLRLEGSGRLEGADLALFVCGEPAFMRGAAYGERVRRAARRLKRARVFFPGYLSSFHKQVYFRLADLFVSPSLHESYGLTIVEAMRAGLPVVASDHYGVAELIRPGFGRVAAYGDPRRRSANLAAAIAELLADPEGLARMGSAARVAAEGMPFSRAADALWERTLALLAGGSA